MLICLDADQVKLFDDVNLSYSLKTTTINNREYVILDINSHILEVLVDVLKDKSLNAVEHQKASLSDGDRQHWKKKRQAINTLKTRLKLALDNTMFINDEDVVSFKKERGRQEMELISLSD